MEIRIKCCAVWVGLPTPDAPSSQMCEHKPACNMQFRGIDLLSGLAHKNGINMPQISLAEVFHASSMSPKTGGFGQAIT